MRRVCLLVISVSVLIVALMTFATFTAAPSQTMPTAKEIVAGVDAVRNPGQPFRQTTTLTEYVGGKPRDQSTFAVYAKVDDATKQYRNLIRFLQPPRDSGKAVLLDAHVFWFYDPASKASVRISPQQQLLGQASIADVLTVNLSLDYAATVVGTDEIDDANKRPTKTWHLDLRATNDRASYNRIELWAEQGTFHPIRGRFYADSGRLLKTLYYRNFQTVLGGLRPTEAIIIDAVDTSLVTDVTFTGYRAQDIPDAWFQREYLPRLRPE